QEKFQVPSSKFQVPNSDSTRKVFSKSDPTSGLELGTWNLEPPLLHFPRRAISISRFHQPAASRHHRRGNHHGFGKRLAAERRRLSRRPSGDAPGHGLRRLTAARQDGGGS